MLRTMLLILICLIIIIGFSIINIRYIRTIKSSRRKIMVKISIFIGAIIIGTFILGYRITPLAASRANGFIQEDFMLIDDLDLDWAYIHFYYDKDNDKYHTTISEKKLFMYVSRSSVWHYGNSEDPIRTIGRMSYSNGKGKTAKLLMIDSDDKNIDSIIIRDEDKVKKTKITIDKPQIILLDDFENWNDLGVLAVDSNDEELYYYGYPKGTNVSRTEDYKWHAIEQNDEH